MAVPDTMPLDRSKLPNHLDLPDSDGGFAQSMFDPFQTMLLDGSLRFVLDRLQPDRRYLIGGDSGVYWKITVPRP